MSPPASQKRTSDFPDFPLKSARLNVNLLGAQITSRSNAYGRDQHAGWLGAETTSEATSEITFKCARISFECAGKCAEGLELLHLQVCNIAFESRLNAILPRSQFTPHLNALGSRPCTTDFPLQNVQIASEREPARRPNHFTFERARTRPTAERLRAKTTSRSKAGRMRV